MWILGLKINTKHQPDQNSLLITDNKTVHSVAPCGPETLQQTRCVM